MKYLVIADIHENFHNLAIILKYCADNQITHGLVLGDLINPGIMHQLGKSNMNLTIILGNNDGDVFNLSKVANEYAHIALFKDYTSVQIESKRIFLIHDNVLGELIARSQEYDVVFCGHNHISSKEVFGKSMLINPGEVSGHRQNRSTFCVWDNDSNEVKLITIANEWIDVNKYKHDTTFQHASVEFNTELL
jgi:putative phosphoesterase